MKCDQLNNLLFCKTASTYSVHGVKKEETKQNSLFLINSAPGVNTNNNLVAQNKLEKTVELFLSGMCSIDILLESFIASVMTGCQVARSTETAQILMVPVFVNTLCMTYSQFKLFISSFHKARGKALINTDPEQQTTMKNQLQALAGFCSAIETGIRFFFNIMVLFNSPNAALKHLLAYSAGTGKFGSFLMASGHAGCDTPFGRTVTGKIVYSFLTSPIAPDFIRYVTTVTPIIEGMVFYSSILTIKDIFELENKALSPIFYGVALFSGMTAFLYQKYFFCEVIKSNVEKNAVTMASFNHLWYGNAYSATRLQKCSYAIKRTVNVVMALPLAACSATDKLASVFCYFLLAILPIQIIAMSQYISQPCLAYCVFYQVFNQMHELIKTYTGKDISPLSQESKYLAALAAIPFGLATAFIVLNIMGGKVLESADKVYRRSIANLPTSDEAEKALLTDGDNSHLSSSTVVGRLRNVLTHGKELAREIISELSVDIRGGIAEEVNVS